MIKNIINLALIITSTLLSNSPTYAKQIYPAEIMGRDLLTFGLGWAGHVGIATTYMMSSAGMKNNADQRISK